MVNWTCIISFYCFSSRLKHETLRPDRILAARPLPFRQKISRTCSGYSEQPRKKDLKILTLDIDSPGEQPTRSLQSSELTHSNPPSTIRSELPLSLPYFYFLFWNNFRLTENSSKGNKSTEGSYISSNQFNLMLTFYRTMVLSSRTGN